MPSRVKNRDETVKKIVEMADSRSSSTRQNAAKMIFDKFTDAEDFESVKAVPITTLSKLARDRSTAVRMEIALNWMVTELLPKEDILKLLSDPDSIIRNAVLDDQHATRKLSDSELLEAAQALIKEYRKTGSIQNTGFIGFRNPDLDRLPPETLEIIKVIHSKSDRLNTLQILRTIGSNNPDIDREIDELTKKPH